LMYRAAIEHDWNNVELLAGLGNVLSRQEDNVGAVLAYRRAIQLGSRDAELHNRLAGILIAHGNLSEAEEILENGIQVAPANADVLASRALLFIYRGKLDAAHDA